MSPTARQEPRRPDAATNRRLAFGVFAAPVAWFTHEIVGVAIAGRHCVGGLEAWQWVVLTTTFLIAAALAASGAVVSFRVLRRWSGQTSPTRADGRDRVEFVALLGVFVSSLLLLNIIYFGAMPFAVEACVRTI